jgi:hypothetical protein
MVADGLVVKECNQRRRIKSYGRCNLHGYEVEMCMRLKRRANDGAARGRMHAGEQKPKPDYGQSQGKAC